MTDPIQPGDWISGPFWDGAVKVVTWEAHPNYDVATVTSDGGDATRTYILTPDDKAALTRTTPADFTGCTFDSHPEHFRLGMQAHRLRLAHAIDPYAGLNASRIDPLPHQFEAVYERLLARPVVRALLAHDAGAGKTIIAGLLLKELQRRQGVKRVLVIATAGLTIQWRREMLTKFGLHFDLVDRAYIDATGSDALLVWRETDHAIASLAFTRQDQLRQALESVTWDLVIVDEAHKMAAYRRPNGTVRKTKAYELGEVLARHSTHFLLMTATPHKGDPENYRLLVSLLDPRQDAWLARIAGQNPMVLRRTKEEMRKPNGDPLYPERIVEPRYYHISPEEGDLLEQVRALIRRHYERAKSVGRQGAAFALLTLERRIASSPYALHKSLLRLREKLTTRLAESARRASSQRDNEDWTAWEELSEQERWQREAAAEDEAAAVMRRANLRSELRRLEKLIARAEALTDQAAQAKLQSLREACTTWVREHGEQLIIFTEFKDTLDYLLARLADWGYTTTQIHGDMALTERRQAERDFWNAKAQILVATEAAGEGINLQCCSVMINYDIPWNPCRLEQRMGRIHRYGQQADEVHIFNLIAKNTMEGEVQAALLKKMERMREDLGNKVFDVVGQVLWADDDLRGILERIALGEPEAVDDARGMIEQAGERARAAKQAEDQAVATAAPLDVAAFRRKQTTFAAHRLSPEEAETFFRRAVPFVGGTLTTTQVSTEQGSVPAFEVALPPGWEMLEVSGMRLSFWAAACSDDETEADAVLFIAPGHRLFEALVAAVIDRTTPILARGATFLDVQPATASPYLIWFVRAQLWDGLERPAGDLLTAVAHRADREEVAVRPTEVLTAFDPGNEGAEIDATAMRQGQAMLAAHEEIVEAGVRLSFLPALAERRAERAEAIARERDALATGLDALIEQLSQEAMRAYTEGEWDAGMELTAQKDAARDRKARLMAELRRAAHLLLTEPEALSVALVLPAPLEVEITDETGTQTVAMRRDDDVEAAAMEAAMRHERAQGRCPQDVSAGNSWDIESYDAQGNLLRYIEVKGRGPAQAAIVSLTAPEWEAARRHGDRHWLYVVRLGDAQFWQIQNPYKKLEPRELTRWLVTLQDVAALGESVTWEA